MDSMKEIEETIKAAVNARYPGHVVRFTSDSDAHDIISVELYDVPDADCKMAKDILWAIIDNNASYGDVMFVPSIFSHAKTARFYAEHLVSSDFDKELTADIFSLLASPIASQLNENLPAENIWREAKCPSYVGTKQFVSENCLRELSDGRDQSDRLAA